MHDHEPCGVDGCPALACSTRGLCAVHDGAKRLTGVACPVKCQTCRQDIQPCEWITESSTIGNRRHAVCPPPKAPHVRKRDAWKPLLDSLPEVAR